MIKVYCNGTRIQCLRQGDLTVGMVGAPVEFDFSSEWDGLEKKAVFRSEGEKEMPIDANGKSVVPGEILTVPGMDVEVGVYAERGDGTTWPAPTTYCRIGRVMPGAKSSGGGGLYVELDTTLTQPGKAADAKAVGDRLSVLENYTPSGSGGLTVAQVNALDKLFQLAAYTKDASAAYDAFKKAFANSGGGTDEPDTPDTPDNPIVTYTVTNNLTNVTNSNAQTEVTEGFYSATLTVADGYVINAVITMGGVDITANVFTAETGSILITEVTGDIVITATAEMATAPVLYQLANTPRTVNANLFEDTGLTFGSATAPGYTKAWTLVAKVKNMTAGTLWCVNGNAGLCSYYEKKWFAPANNNAVMLSTKICAAYATPTITEASPDEVCIVITKDAMAEKTASLHYLTYTGELKTDVLVGTYGNFFGSIFDGNMMVGGQTSADFVGTIEEFTIYEGVATADQIKAYLGVA